MFKKPVAHVSKDCFRLIDYVQFAIQMSVWGNFKKHKSVIMSVIRNVAKGKSDYVLGKHQVLQCIGCKGVLEEVSA